MLELREKARYYKSRALEGNYFSREYLSKLDAELEQLYDEQDDDSKKQKQSGSVGPGARSRDELSRRENEDVSRQHSPKESGRPRVKHAWGSKESSDNIEDAQRVYRNLNEQFKDVPVDSNETGSSPSEHDSIHRDSSKQALESNVNQRLSERGISQDNKNEKTSKLKQKLPPTSNRTSKASQTIKRDKPLQGTSSSYSENVELYGGEKGKIDYKAKTSDQKPLPTPTQNDRGAILRTISSGSDASSELSTESRDSGSGDSNLNSPDKFDIKKVQGMHSNDYKPPSISVCNNYDSDSVRKNDCDSDSYLSQSSIASRESSARKTLDHAKQRKENFW